MSERDEIQKALGDVISAMFSGISVEIRESDSFKTIMQNPALLAKPDLLFSQVFYPLNQALGEAIVQTQNFSKEYVHLAKHVYLNHQFYHWQLRSIFSDLEGMSCCADKARFVLRYFIQIAKGETTISETWEGESFARPNLNNPKLWIDYIEGLCRLHSGNISSYLKIRSKIENEYK